MSTQTRPVAITSLLGALMPLLGLKSLAMRPASCGRSDGVVRVARAALEAHEASLWRAMVITCSC